VSHSAWLFGRLGAAAEAKSFYGDLAKADLLVGAWLFERAHRDGKGFLMTVKGHRPALQREVID
jgi:hypothetical protein